MTIRPAHTGIFKRIDLTAASGMNGWCGVQDCREPQFTSYPLCEEHAWALHREMDIRKRYNEAHGHPEAEEERFNKLQAKRTAQRNGTFQSDPGLVYYIQVENQVEIGWTANLATRLATYPPMARLLATHPGTKKTERAIHEKFTAYLAGRAEWFALHDELTAHIESVRQQFKQDERVVA